MNKGRRRLEVPRLSQWCHLVNNGPGGLGAAMPAVHSRFRNHKAESKSWALFILIIAPAAASLSLGGTY